MEPQLEGCGKCRLKALAWPGSKLQWSRNLRVAERKTAIDVRSHIKWLQWSRNLRVAERAKTSAALSECLGASMEPQLEGCGKHDMRGVLGRGYRRLQWSRNLRVAESLDTRTALAGPLTCFNGAAT